MPSSKKIAIIGGGLAGLTAANYLEKANFSFSLFEKNEVLGGRVASDEIDGFILDHGFQVFLDSYDEAKKVIDFNNLKLCRAASGAVIRNNNKWDKIGNPLKNWGDLIPTLFSNITSFRDKFLILKLYLAVNKLTVGEINSKENKSTFDFLKSYGFSEKIIQDFFMPFFGGVFLDFELKTSSRLFLYLFQKFASGNATLPTGGMKTIAEELSNGIRNGQIFTNSEVKSLLGNQLSTSQGEKFDFDQIIIATETDSNLLKADSKWNGTLCYYFFCDESEIQNGEYLHLIPQGKIVKHVCFLNRINPFYSKNGKELLSVTTISDGEFDEVEVKKELMSLFNNELSNLTFLKKYDIPKALNFYDGEMKGVHKNELGHIVCGDHTMYPSINAAMKSGRLAAEMAIAALS